MNKSRKKTLWLILLSMFLLTSCIDDRMPPEPVEINRPEFVKFDPVDGDGLNVSLNSTIQAHFNEQMDLNTFPGNFIVKGISGEIKGTFSYGASDTIVVYSPLTNYQEAEVYTVTVSGAVKDIHGNSWISPVEDEVTASTWFFTQGQYSNQGFPYVFVRDKTSKNQIYRTGNLNSYIDDIILPGEEDYQVSSIGVDPVADFLYVVNLKISGGIVSVIDPSSFQLVNQTNVGFGPTSISFSDDKGYVSCPSSNSFSVIDLNSQTTETNYEFSDGFKPKDAVYSALTNKIYFYNSGNTTLKVVNADNYDDSHVVETDINSKPIDIEITEDGRYIYLIETSSSEVAVFDVQTETVSTLIDFGYQYNTDGVMGTDHYYLAYYRGTGGQDVGGVLKIEIASNSITQHLQWTYQVDQMKLTAAEELIYAVTPIDSTVRVIETKTLKNITSTKVNGSLKFVAVTGKNY